MDLLGKKHHNDILQRRERVSHPKIKPWPSPYCLKVGELLKRRTVNRIGRDITASVLQELGKVTNQTV